jgi:hypothetical protein
MRTIGSLPNTDRGDRAGRSRFNVTRVNAIRKPEPKLCNFRAMSTRPAPPGWYLDPSDGSHERWWDGTRWSEHSRPLGVAAPVSHPPGWYQDANGATRYWDGHEWTEHVAHPPAPPAPAPALAPAVKRLAAFWWAIAAAVALIVGGIGPWATALRVVEVSGTRGGDGWLVVGAGLVAIVVLFASPNDAGPVVGLLGGIGGAIVGIVDLSDIQSRGALVEPAWGIYVVLIGAAALFVASLVLIVQRR